ncbi:MAG: hypothetical protein KBF33_04420 [Comamonas sp.]|nr:hypothetical protein [Comamonas sp.]
MHFLSSAPAARAAPAVQRGMATVLIILLMGTGLTASVLGAAHYLRSTQDQNIASHAQTQAQMNAWSAVEIVRNYLTQLQVAGKIDQLAVGNKLNFSGDDVAGLMYASVTGVQGSGADLRMTISVTGVTNPSAVTGETHKGDKRGGASATLQVVYAPTGGTSGGVCAQQQPKRSILNGNVTYTGGGMQFLTAEGQASNFVINGNLSVSNGSEAIVSGCVTGDIALSGGGIKAGADLQSEQKITIKSMSPPSRVGLWAREIDIDQDGGSYSNLYAGGFSANVRNARGMLLGRATLGGKKQADGAINPLEGYAPVVMVTVGESRFQLNRADLSWNAATGRVEFADSAVQRLAGDGTLQGPLRFDDAALDGGDLKLKSSTIPGLVWGGGVTFGGWGGTYGDVRAHGNLKMNEPKIGTLLGGGNLVVGSWNLPQFITNAKVVGSYTNSGGNKGSVGNLQTGQAGVTPAMPGLPRCEVAVSSFDAAALRSQANYVFDFDAQGEPRLTVQHVNIKGATADTAFPAASFNLKTVPFKTLQQVNGKDFLGCSWQNPASQYNDALQCLRGATPSTGWTLTGITKFPPGVALFMGNVTINGNQQSGGLVNTLLSTGKVTLTNSGSNLKVTAPNFVASPATLCDGDFYPSNLCNKSVTPSRLVTWAEADGTEHSGLPIGNIAVASNSDLSAAGWSLNGHVIVGGQISSGGAMVTIDGTLTVGANGVSATNITQGGVKVITRNLTNDQGYLPGGASCSTSAPTGGGMKVLWSRYS